MGARNARGMITAVTSQTGIAGFDGPRSWSYGYDALGRLVSADRAAGTAEDRAYAYDDADNLVWNSGLCATNPNMAYPAQGPASVRPHAPSRSAARPSPTMPTAIRCPMTVTGQAQGLPAASPGTARTGP